MIKGNAGRGKGGGGVSANTMVTGTNSKWR